MQIHPEVTTRKILLLGHSQGSFYTDEMYEYLITHGVPKESIAVYNVATPESYVGGGGGYLTSTNDKVINYVRDSENAGNLQVYLNTYYVHTSSVVNSALRANITLPKEKGWDTDPHGGHGFSAAYLPGAADRIVRDVSGELGALKAKGGADSLDGCFTPPPPSLAYKAEQAAFGVADSLVGNSFSAGRAAGNGALALTNSALGALSSGLSRLTGIFRPDSSRGQAAASALPLDGRLPIEPTTPKSPRPTPDIPQQTRPAPAQNDVLPPTVASVAPSANPPAPESVSPVPRASISQSFGGGGGGASPAPQPQESPRQNQDAPAVALSITSPADGASFATTSVAFMGATDPGALVTATFGSVSASTTADGSGRWSLPLRFSEGTARVDVAASDPAGHTSPSVSRTVTVDITPPDAPLASVAACAASLIAGGCLLPATTADVTWSAASGAAYYAVAGNGAVGATTTALSSQAILAGGATTTLAVVAYDAAGNAATSTPVDVAAVLRPLLVNEIGWAGTDLDPTEQWIEIKNTTPFALDLSHIALHRSLGPPIPLSGTLPTADNGGFFIISFGNADLGGPHVVKNVVPLLSTTTAENLSLVWNASTTIDAAPEAAACPGWCAGSMLATLGTNLSGDSPLTTPLSMERKPDTDGALAASWQNTDSYGPWIGFGGARIYGTRGGENSAGLPDAGVYCGQKTNLLTSNTPPGPAFNPGAGGCTYLAKFITGSAFGADRVASLYAGDIGSSTALKEHLMERALGLNTADSVPAGTPAGAHFFFAIYETRFFTNDRAVFNPFFLYGASSTLGISGPPHGNYITLPFTYSP